MTHIKASNGSRPKIAVALGIGLAAIIAPILASVYFAWHQSLALQRSICLGYAQETLRRLDETAHQFALGNQRLSQAKLPPCSPQEIELLRQIHLGSGYIQAAGRASGDSLLCSSLGETTPVSLGKPNLVSAGGVREYFGIKLWSDQSRPLDVFAGREFAMVVDPSLPIDVNTEGPDVEIAVFVPSVSRHDHLAAIGRYFPSSWFQPVGRGEMKTFLDQGYLVAIDRSATWDLAVIGAVPEHYIFGRVLHFALIFAPIGLFCGFLLAWAANYLALMRSSFPVMLRRALRNKQFHLEYQPIVDLQSRRIVAAEALIRWKSPEAKMRPDSFIPLAEDSGLIHLITEQVLEIVRQDLPRILQTAPDFEVALNMSVGDLRSIETLEKLDRLLNDTGARPHNIGIEATERAFLSDPETTDLISTLRDRGFRVAIDDFGTGYSSLACLQTLSLDALKIDRSFVETIGTGGATSQVVLHIIDMAHSLQLEMIAEGVETEAQAEFLAHRGVRYAQGWLFARPMPLDHLLQVIGSETSAPVVSLA